MAAMGRCCCFCTCCRRRWWWRWRAGRHRQRWRTSWRQRWGLAFRLSAGRYNSRGRLHPAAGAAAGAAAAGAGRLLGLHLLQQRQLATPNHLQQQRLHAAAPSLSNINTTCRGGSSSRSTTAGAAAAGWRWRWWCTGWLLGLPSLLECQLAAAVGLQQSIVRPATP